MKIKYLVIGIVLVLGVTWFGYTITEWNKNVIGYADIESASVSKKLSYIKGYWVKEKPITQEGSQFVFYLKDDHGSIAKVIYPNGKPNNFEHATSVVVQGKMEEHVLYAKEILVKCPSKYQSEQADKDKSKQI